MTYVFIVNSLSILIIVSVGIMVARKVVESGRTYDNLGQHKFEKIEEGWRYIRSNGSFVFSALLFLFVMWMMFGGVLEDHGTYRKQNTVNIDCRQVGWSNSPYCNGEYDSRTQEQDFNENNYYQNAAR